MSMEQQTDLLPGLFAPARLPWESILDALPEAVVCLEDGAKIIYINRATESLFLLNRTNAMGQPILFSDQLAQLFNEAAQLSNSSATEVSPFQRSMEITLGEGESKPLEIAITESTRDQHRIQTAVIRDLTAMKLMEDALVQSRKSQAIGALAGGIAHDFNNILTALLSQLDLALDTPDLQEEARECVVHAQTSGRRAAELISRLQTFSRQAETKTTVIDLAEVIEQVVLILQRTIDRRVDIDHDELESGEWLIKGDASQFIQAVLNLCLNARDAMPDGGTLTLRLNRCERKKKGVSTSQFIRLTIQDTGAGIPEGVIKRIFEPYFTTRTIGRGTGLGLSIAQNIVQDMGGWIEVESKDGKGSQFHLLLQDSPAEPGASTSALRDFVSTETRALEGKESILIADDEEMVRLVMRAVLSYRGYQVTEATDGENMMEIARESNGQFDLVLLDVDMPRLNGWDALKQIVEEFPKSRVILLSGGSVESDEEKARELGAAGFLCKPFKNDVLIHLVRKTLDARK